MVTKKLKRFWRPALDQLQRFCRNLVVRLCRHFYATMQKHFYGGVKNAAHWNSDCYKSDTTPARSAKHGRLLETYLNVRRCVATEARCVSLLSAKDTPTVDSWTIQSCVFHSDDAQAKLQTITAVRARSRRPAMEMFGQAAVGE